MIIDALSIGDICAFYDDEGEEYCVGFFLGSDEEFSMFQLITPRGFDDGLYITLTDSIYRVDVDTDYVKKINKLFWLHKQEMIVYQHNGGNLLEFILDHSEQNDFAVTCVLGDDSEIVGFIDARFEFGIRINCFDEFGKYAGQTYVSKDAVVKVGTNSVAMKNIKLLRDN